MIRTGLRYLITLASVIVLSACAISQPSPPAGDAPLAGITVSQAIESERLTELDQIVANPATTDEQRVRWGGSIASVMNRSDGSTLLEIVSRPLHSGGRPIHDDRSDGRFLALLDGFLDPEIVKVGRDMTVVGRLSGKAAGKVGESDYLFPVVLISDYRFWKPVVTIPPGHFSHWNRYPPFGHADPFRRDWPFGSRLNRPGRR
ncbi:Slp family lipoprotein [Granulosicoccus sp. 3-233]|uniref:Slp family lipoprotein n=1 Tax=Granulosicoccus sp. 3-233 TaxID=3417969 RepID=UPI003D33EEF5